MNVKIFSSCCSNLGAQKIDESLLSDSTTAVGSFIIPAKRNRAFRYNLFTLKKGIAMLVLARGMREASAKTSFGSFFFANSVAENKIM